MKAKVKWVGIDQAKYNPDITQLTIGFEVEGDSEEKLRYLNLPILGGSEGQSKYAGAALSNLLKQATFDVVLEENERGYVDVKVPREQPQDDAGF